MCDNNNPSTQSIADYLAQLLKDRKQLAAFPNVFMHMERLLDEGGWKFNSTNYKKSKYDDLAAQLLLKLVTGTIVNRMRPQMLERTRYKVYFRLRTTELWSSDICNVILSFILESLL